MRIAEIFAGIEGEGVRIGVPQVFVRTQGCSIRCKFCDSQFTWPGDKGKELSPDQVLLTLEKNAPSLKVVSITGGNPLEQKDIVEVVSLLSRKGYWMNIEATGQDYNSEVFRLVDFISCDIKTPSSGVKANIKTVKKILGKYDYKTQVKCVVKDKSDLNFVCSTYEDLMKDRKLELKMIVTPCWSEDQQDVNKDTLKLVQKRLFDEGLPIRVIVQQHKFLHGVSTRGV